MFKLNWINKISAPLKVFIFLAVLVFIPIIVSAATLTAGPTGGYVSPVNSGFGTVDLWDASCKKITNTAAIPYFIPTKSSPEWTAFTSYKPATITITECATVCGPGYYVSGTSCFACGSANLYKATTDSSTSCLTVDVGYYSTGGTDATNRTGESYCPAGYYCSVGVAYNCGCGYYCTGGTNQTACGANQYNAGINGTSAAACTACTAGNISSPGSCSSASCSALSCSAGYYVSGYDCLACGTDNYYCTGGVRYAVSTGYYSTGTVGARSGQTQCAANYYCLSGVSYACPGGTPYSNPGATSCVACLSASQCGTNGYEGATTCTGGNVYQDYRTYSCTSNVCGSSAPSTLKTTCSGATPYCVGGSCVACTVASDCGTDGWEGATTCTGGNVYQNYRTYSCNSNVCSSSAPSTLKTSCSTANTCQTGGGCSAGACVAVSNATAGTDPNNNCTRSYNSCSGNNQIGPDGNCNGSGACNTGGASSACATANACQTGGGCSAGNCVTVNNVAAGTDPSNQCTASYNSCSGNNQIGPDGNCNGSGACNTAGRSTACLWTEYCSSGTCITRTCPAGQYVYNMGSYSICMDCGSDALYTSSVNSQTACTSITNDGYMTTGPAGARTGQTLCTGGYWCCSGGICSSCSGGFYCPAGTGYQTAPYNSSSNPCPAGSYCPAISAAPTTCPAGSYCPAYSSSPTACPVHKTSNAGASDVSQCFPDGTCATVSDCNPAGWIGATSCSGSNLQQAYTTPTCNAGTCSYSFPLTTKQVCGSSDCGGGCELQANLQYGCSTGYYALGTKCNGTTPHYVCDGSGNCTAPTHAVTMHDSSPISSSNIPCTNLCYNQSTTLYASCDSGQLTCWQSPSYTYTPITCTNMVINYNCNSAYLACYCNYYSYN